MLIEMSAGLKLARLRITADITSELGIIRFSIDYFKLFKLRTYKGCKLLI